MTNDDNLQRLLLATQLRAFRALQYVGHDQFDYDTLQRLTDIINYINEGISTTANLYHAYTNPRSIR